MKRKLEVKIDAGKEYCGECKHLEKDFWSEYAACSLFKMQNYNIPTRLKNNKSNYLRLQECLDAEKVANDEGQKNNK